MIVEVGVRQFPLGSRRPGFQRRLYFNQLKNYASDFPSHLEYERGEVILKAQVVLYDSTPVPRNIDRVMMLISNGTLSPEFRFPDGLYQHLSSIYSTWFSKLPEQVRNRALPYLYNCDLAEQLKEVGKGGGWGPRVPLKAPSTLETSALLRCL